MPKIIVTGGAGFIGSRFVALLLENDLPGFEDWDVIVIDALTYAGSYQNIVGFEENLEHCPRYLVVTWARKFMCLRIR